MGGRGGAEKDGWETKGGGRGTIYPGGGWWARPGGSGLWAKGRGDFLKGNGGGGGGGGYLGFTEKRKSI